MTSYTQNDYYFNEIDALSCNNRPISSTLRNKGTYNAYESQTEDETTSYDIYGNQEYNDGSSCDSYNHQQRSTSTMSNADNLMYHRDACSGDSSDRYDNYSTLDYVDYDNLRGDSINYVTTSGVEDGNGRPFTALGDSNNKMLPQVPPVQHSHSMWDGMYSSGQHRQSNVSLPSTPTFPYNGGSVGGRGLGSNNGDWDRGFIANGVKDQLNGQRYYDKSGGGFYGHRPPERILPLPQSQQPQTYAKKYLKHKFFEDNSDNMATTTSSMSAYRNQINLDYKKDIPVQQTVSENLPPYNLYYDNGSLIEPPQNSRDTDYNNSHNNYEYPRYSIEPRPHTAMQSRDDYNDFGLNSMDNMSTYSDTVVPTANTYANQQKLQDLQKCRYSIIMAMTTASVIASGETRIPQHLLKKTTKPSAGHVADATSSGALKAGTGAGLTSSSISFRYDDSSSGFGGMGSSNKNSSISGSNNLTSCAYTNSSAAFPPVTLTAAASSSMLLLSSASPIVADSANSSIIKNDTATTTERASSSLSMLKNLTSRKLPKHHTGRGQIVATNKQLPQSPQYLLSHAGTSKTLPDTPQTTLSLKANDTLDNISLPSSILSTTSITLTTSTSTSSTSKISLAYQGKSLASSSLIATAAKTTDAATTSLSSTSVTTTAAAVTTTAANLLPNNNNNTPDLKNYDNVNNYKNNNNFFNNNVQNTDDKYSMELFQTKPETSQENIAKDIEEPLYHLSTTPSRLNSITAINYTSAKASPQFKIGTAYDSLISSSSPVATINETITTTTTTLSSSVRTTATPAELDNDYKTTFTDYTDYLKPYTLPTFSSSNSNGSSNNTNLQFTINQSCSISSSSSYLPYPNLDINTDYLTQFTSSITSLSTTITSSVTSTTTPASVTASEPTSTILAINNRGLNNIITALNLSDNNISRKSSISSPVTKIASPSGSVDPITSISAATTILSSNVQSSIASSSSNMLTTYLDHTSMSTSTILQQDHKDQLLKTEVETSLDTNQKTNTKESDTSLHIEDYDNYLKDYKLDFISASTIITATTLSSPTTHTSVTTTTSFTSTSSSTLNNSWPTSTMSSYTIATTTPTTTIKSNDNTSSYTINNNKESTDTVLSTFTPNCLFTTTETKAPNAELTPMTATSTSALTSTKHSVTTVESDTSKSTLAYSDYLKYYNNVTASSSTSLVSELTDKTSQELPAYIMDFLSTSCDYDSQNYLNLYKIKEEDMITNITTDLTSLKVTPTSNITTNNNNDIATSSQSYIVKDTPEPTFKDVTSTITEFDPTVTTHTTSDLITISSPSSSTLNVTSTENQLTANTALTTMVDFDDNFYSSFSVNLNSLMAVDTAISTDTMTATTSATTSEISKPPLISETTSSFDTYTAPVSLTTDTTKTSKSLFNISTLVESSSARSDVASDFYTTTSSMATTTAGPISTTPSTSVPSSSTASQKTTTAGIKAASMLGGLSQSLKGGLDGVLAAASSNEPQQQKRGFGFSLASKFVPNVGGLLGSATKSATTTQPTKSVVTEPTTTTYSPHITEANQKQMDYNYDSTMVTTAAITSSNYVPSSLNGELYYDDVPISTNAMDFMVSTHTTDMYGNGEQQHGGLYYNSSQTTFYHMTSSLDYAQDEMANHSEQMLLYDDAATEDMHDMNKEYFADDNQAIDVYGGYSEYDTVTTTGHYIDTSMAYSAVSDIVPNSTVSTGAPLASTTMQSNNSTTVTAAKKATSSLLSSLTNVASQISQQTSTAAPAATTTAAASTCSTTANTSSTKSSSGGGLFGSFLGKAAVAMQTATQVVNQGASMASTKVQKNLQTTSTVSLTKQTDEPTTCAANTVYVTQNNYQISHQDSLVSPYASSLGGSGDDYDNSNIPTTTDGNFVQHQLDDDQYYYANQNQQHINQQQSQQKLLPTVPPAGGSTGKKLPTINDKSGYLVKQQPTEIYEEDTEVLDNKSLAYQKMGPTFDIDSEQADYYMDTPQPVAPSARHRLANGYYEHTNGVGTYDYRDDYFNEEDEFKYLEKEKIQATNKQQQQLRQIHKQSSLQYVVDDDYQQRQNDIMDEEYMDDMYHSEDSGNYLDESSSGSVKGLRSHQQAPSTTASTSLEDSHHPIKTSSNALSTTTTSQSVPVTTASHQQIKKQDSIILEEDEKDETSSIIGLPDTGVTSPSKSLSRKSSHDIVNAEDDQMGDLQMVSSSLRSSQSRKMKLMRGETEEVVGGHMQIMKRKTEVTAKQRWHWAYNKIIMQLNYNQ